MWAVGDLAFEDILMIEVFFYKEFVSFSYKSQ